MSNRGIFVGEYISGSGRRARIGTSANSRPAVLIVAGLLCMPCAFASDATAAVASDRPAYEIEAGTLAAALSAFAGRAGVTLSIEPSLVEGLKSAGLSGHYSVEEGLSRLLAGTRLQAVEQGAGVYVLQRLPGAERGAVLLPQVKVTGTIAEDSPVGPLEGYVARRSAAGTKTDTPIVETPQSISIVGASEIEAIKAQNLIDALGYVAGVARVEGLDRTTESLLIRGFEAWADNGSLYRDGSKYGVNLNGGTQEPYGLERVELLKGAASVLYGAAAPGGIINTVSKRPTSERIGELNLEAGSFDRRQLSGDFGGALGEGSDWSYRLTFLARDSDSFIDYVPDDRRYIAPALKWQPSEATSITLLSEYQHDRTAYVYALPAEGTVLPNVNGKIDRDRFVGVPGFDRYDNDRGSVGYLFEHAFSSRLKLRNSARYFGQSNARPFTYIAELLPDQRTASRGLVYVEDRSAAATSDTSLQYSWAGNGIEHTVLAGADYVYQKHRQATSTGEIDALDLFEPDYGAEPGELTYFGTRRFRDRKTGVYAQDQMKILQRWVLLLGARQDWSKNDSEAATATQWTRESNDAFSARAGLVYLADNGLAPFASFSQSFEPTSGNDRSGARLKPSRGEQYEAGIRYQPADAQVLLSATVYQLTKTNVGVTDPVDTLFTIQRGEVRSRGVELEARASLTTQLAIIAAYAYTDARTLESGPLTPELDGARTGGVPYHQLSLWADYDFTGLIVPGLKAGAGVRHVGSTMGSYVAAEVPAFTLVDAMLSYTHGPWRLALNATNLGDENYVASCTYGCFYGEPRKLIASVGYRW